ncbi:hypothetical protein WM008_21980, partial [Vibrio vulnificus]
CRVKTSREILGGSLNKETSCICKINNVKFHNFMKASLRKLCEILQVKLHHQNKILKSALKLVRFLFITAICWLLLFAKAVLKQPLQVD